MAIVCRRACIAAAVSILCGALVFFLSTANNSPRKNSGYVVLAVDAALDDRGIQEILTHGGLDAFISESSQNVPLDDFGFLRMIPLDTFRSEIEPFDPRDTGYAQKLRSFFVRDGKRFFFFPLDASSPNPAKLNALAASLLPDIPFSLEYMGYKRFPFLNFALLVAACAFVLCFSRSRRLFVFTLPVLLALGGSGSSAFIIAPLLAAMWELLRQPVRELSAAWHKRRAFAAPAFLSLWEQLKPFRLNCLLLALFAVLFAVFSTADGLSLVFAAAFLNFFLVYVLALRAELDRTRKNRHVLFMPVPLLPSRAKTFSLFPLLAPFGLASVLALFLPLVFPGLSPSGYNEYPFDDPQYLVSAEDYERHIAFQKAFPYQPLADSPQQPLTQQAYQRYYLGEDGLIAGSASYATDSWAIPLFPLEKLMDFLVNYQGSRVPDLWFAAPGASLFVQREWVIVAIILTAWIFDSFPPERIMGKKPGPLCASLVYPARLGSLEQRKRRLPS